MPKAKQELGTSDLRSANCEISGQKHVNAVAQKTFVIVCYSSLTHRCSLANFWSSNIADDTSGSRSSYIVDLLLARFSIL